MLTLIEDIIIQSEPEKQDENQISEKIFHNVSDSEIKFLRRVSFWTKLFFRKRDFKEKINFKKHDFEEKNIFKKQILK